MAWDWPTFFTGIGVGILISAFAFTLILLNLADRTGR